MRNRGRGYVGRVLLLLVLVGACTPAQRRDLVPGRSSTEVGFRTEDGFRLQGEVFGEGPDVVILSHMRPADQSSWFDFAESLTEHGYRALTFNFRGYGSSEGAKVLDVIDRDVRGAIRFSRDQGAERVILIGASMGGTASMVAAASEPVDGVVTLSAPDRLGPLDAAAAAGSVDAGTLFIVAQEDEPYVGQAESLFKAAAEPSDIKIVPGSDHGTDLLGGSQGKSVKGAIRDFLEEALG